MSTTSSLKPMPTLKGIFNVPSKMNYRRDFLRENKLSLRELQRVTTKKQLTQQQEQQQKQQRQQQQHQQKQQLYIGGVGGARRSISQQRLSPVPQSTTTTHQPRSYSQQRASNLNNNILQRHPQQNLSTPSRCPSCNGRDVASISTLLSKAESCDKEIQTEDIHDEQFLYHALKKCTTSEPNTALSAKGNVYSNDVQRTTCSDPNVPLSNRYGSQFHEQGYDKQHHRQSTNYDEEHNQYQQHYHQQQQKQEKNTQNVSACLNHYTSDDNHQLQQPPQHTSYTSRSNETPQINGHFNAASAMDDTDLQSNFGNLALDTQREASQPLMESLPLSARSRQTICSQQIGTEGALTKKRSSGSLHKFGSRDDVRLPRYLEREKREKEELRMREIDRDRNCPQGHFALNEHERQTALSIAEKKFKALVSELNHMPMTTETLRIRTRKNEIERELVTLEADIRIFSKPKVYVKQPQQED